MGKPTVVEVPIGVDVMTHDLVRLDLSQHAGVFGSTGSGKSNVCRLILDALVPHTSGLAPDKPRVELHCCDLKQGVELGPFAPWMASFCREPDELFAWLVALRSRLDERMALLRERRCRDWADIGDPYLVVLVDEHAELQQQLAAGQRARAEAAIAAAEALSALLRMGRAAGVCVVICTQRPDADVLPGQLRSCLNATVCPFTPNATSAAVMLGQAAQGEAAERIVRLGVGEALVVQRGRAVTCAVPEVPHAPLLVAESAADAAALAKLVGWQAEVRVKRPSPFVRALRLAVARLAC